MTGQNRVDIYPGLEVDIILKKDQRTWSLHQAMTGKAGKTTRSVV